MAVNAADVLPPRSFFSTSPDIEINALARGDRRDRSAAVAVVITDAAPRDRRGGVAELPVKIEHRVRVKRKHGYQPPPRRRSPDAGARAAATTTTSRGETQPSGMLEVAHRI
jgi:hypothetical protein